MAEPMYCYRHPDRETGVTCSECGRPICTECMFFAPVGIRCPDHSGQPQGHSASHANRSARQLRERRRDRHEDPHRDQRRGLPARARPRRRGQRHEQPNLQRGLPGRPAGRRRRLVAPLHRHVPPLRPVPPRAEHARALVVRLGRGAGARARPVSPPLHRLRARGLGGSAALDAEQRDGRRLRRDLRDPRRGARPRATAHLRPRRRRLRDHRDQSHHHLRPARDLDRRPPRRARRRRPGDTRALALRPGTTPSTGDPGSSASWASWGSAWPASSSPTGASRPTPDAHVGALGCSDRPWLRRGGDDRIPDPPAPSGR